MFLGVIMQYENSQKGYFTKTYQTQEEAVHDLFQTFKQCLFKSLQIDHPIMLSMLTEQRDMQKIINSVTLFRLSNDDLAGAPEWIYLQKKPYVNVSNKAEFTKKICSDTGAFVHGNTIRWEFKLVSQ